MPRRKNFPILTLIQTLLIWPDLEHSDTPTLSEITESKF